jgi:LuxR family maltose regulon positive regulatory protein
MDQLLRQHPQLVSGALEARVGCSLFTSIVIRQPHHPDIEYWADRTYRASAGQPDINLRMSVEPRVALGVVYGGHFPKAWSILQGVRAIIATHAIRSADLPMFRLVEATYFMLTAQKQPCYDAVEAGLAIERAEGITIMSHQLLAYGAGGALAVSDLDTAEHMLRAFEALPRTTARFDLCLYHLFSAWLAMRRNDALRAFQAHKLALQAAIEVGCPVFEALCRMAAAQVLYKSDDLRGALANFQRMYGLAKPIRNHLLEFTGLMSYAWVALDSGRRPRSGMRALRQALSVGKPRNYLSHLLWLPESLSRLCSIALENGIETEFVHRLIRERSLAIDASLSATLDWPWPIRVHTLGPFRVLTNNKPLLFSGKAQRRPLELLKVIIAYGGRDVSEDRITTALWPRIDGDSAHRSFTTTLHRLRKLIGTERAIALSEGKVSLNGHLVWTDVWAFEQIAAHIAQWLRHTQHDAGDATIPATGEQLLQCYGGGFLINESSESWTLPMQERLRHRFVRAVSDLQRYWQSTQRIERSIELLERALDVEGLAESLYRELMVCYAEAGRQADAVETYRRCEKMLKAGLNIAPSAETTALRDRLASAR